MFKAIRKMKVREDRGFTLVELLIVVAIIGILAAIAIPQFGAYRRRGYNASANSDLRNIRTTEEAVMADFSEYAASNSTNIANGATYGSAATGAGPGTLYLIPGKSSSVEQSVSLSPNVYAAVEALPNGAGTVARTDYSAVTIHAQGDNYYGADSDVTTLYRAGITAATTPTADVTLAAAPDPTNVGATVKDDFTGVTCGSCSGPWVTTQ